jgi:carbon-monoxide dehydrogenase medium subunit
VQPFELLQPTSLEEALAFIRDDPDTRPLAGGTALVVLLKQGLLRPERLMNLKRIPEARGIFTDVTGATHIGALTSIGQVERDTAVRATYPALAEACHLVANVRIRNLATLGGNLAHADYQSDPPSILVALDARVRIRSATAAREEMLADFIKSSYQTSLEPGELLTEIIVPAPSDGQRTAYRKFTTRSAEDRPCAGVAIRAAFAGELVDELRVVIGAVSPAPLRVVEAEGLAIGQRMREPLADDIGAIASAAVDPIDDVRGSAEYKRRLVRVLVRRMLMDLDEDVAS